TRRISRRPAAAVLGPLWLMGLQLRRVQRRCNTRTRAAIPGARRTARGAGAAHGRASHDGLFAGEHTGDLAQARVHFDRAVALYDPAAHRPIAARFGQDNRVTALSYGSVVVWLLGYPEAALADAERAVKYARELGQAAALMYALFYASWTTICSGRYDA